MTSPSPIAPPTRPVPAPRGVTEKLFSAAALDRGTGFVRAARKGDGLRFDLVMRRVGGVELAREIVETNFAIGAGRRTGEVGPHQSKFAKSIFAIQRFSHNYRKFDSGNVAGNFETIGAARFRGFG